MISPSTGEVRFSDGLVIVGHRFVFQVVQAPKEVRTRRLTVPGWTCYALGEHPSEHGTFEVEVIAGPEQRVHVAFLSHKHAFYQPQTPEDSERRTYHEGIIATDLRGQREFPWGQAGCKLDRESNTDWLVVAYSQGPHVPNAAREALRRLVEQDKPVAR